MSYKAKRRSRSGEIWAAVTKHDRVQVNPIFIDQAEFGEAVCQDRAGHFDLPLLRRFQLADRLRKIVVNKLRIGPDRLQRSRNDPLPLVPPRRGEGCSSSPHSGWSSSQ